MATPAQGMEAWLAAMTRPTVLIEIGVFVACIGVAWLLVRGMREAMQAGQPPHGVLFGKRLVDGMLFPLIAWLLTLTARWLLATGHLGLPTLPIAFLNVGAPILGSLVVIRLTVQVLRVAFPASHAVRVVERSVSWAVWGGLVLWATGLLPLLLAELEAIHWKVGGANVSLRSLLEGALAAAAVLVFVLWLSAVIEARLLAGAKDNLSVRKIAANATRALLLLVGLMLALSAAGIPLGALSVFGGAVGVGLAFGLQKLAANYVSGFVILAERSLRIGDVVRVDNFEGQVTDINTRYTVIRAPNGRESIVPNEMLITQRVENSSLADPRIAITSTLQVAYGSDLDSLMPRLAQAAVEVPRVLADPPPGVQLTGFGTDGLDLAVVFWIGDPQNGQGNVKSEVNLALLRAVNAAGVSIPYPQRVMHQAS